MKLLTFKKVRLSVLTGILLSVVLTYFEFKNIAAYIETDSRFVQTLLFLLGYQAMILSITFFSIALIRNHINTLRREPGRLQKTEKVGLIFQLLSVFPAIATVLQLCPPILLSILSIFLVCLGIKLYCNVKSGLALSFVLWGINLYILLHFTMLSVTFLSVWM